MTETDKWLLRDGERFYAELAATPLAAAAEAAIAAEVQRMRANPSNAAVMERWSDGGRGIAKCQALHRASHYAALYSKDAQELIAAIRMA